MNLEEFVKCALSDIAAGPNRTTTEEAIALTHADWAIKLTGREQVGAHDVNFGTR